MDSRLTASFSLFNWLEGKRLPEYTFGAGVAVSSNGQPVQPPGNTPPDDLRIESWKQIAAFFGRDERTVKRWEKTRKLPIRRLPGEKGGVFAYSRELTDWLNSAGKADRDAGSNLTGSQPQMEEPPLDALPRPDEAAPPSDSAKPAQRAGWFRKVAVIATAAVVFFCLVTVAFILHGRAIRADKPSRPPSGSESSAQDLYLQGRFAWNHRTSKSLRQALDDFNQAIAKDPSYAPAYAGLADCYDLMPQYAGAANSDAFPRAVSAARKALALDPTLPEAHRSLAFALFYGEWDVNAAFREFHRAIELAPGDAETHSWFATSLLTLGRTAEAKGEIARARELNPTSRSILANQAFILYNDGDRSTGIEKLKALESAEPDFLGPSGYLAQIFLWERNYPAYLAELKHMAEVSGEPDQLALASAAARGWSASGERGLLKQLRSFYLDEFRSGKSSGFEVALVDSLLGYRQEADHFFQAAVDSCDYRMMAVLNGKFDPLMEGDRDFLNIKEEIRSGMRL